MDPGSYKLLPSGRSSPWHDTHDRALQTCLSQDIATSNLPPEHSAILEMPAKMLRTSFKSLYVAWRWESACCFFVLAIPFIILATLYPHDGLPLPQWPFQISVNTLLSVYSIALRGGLSFITVSCIGQLQWGWFSQRRPLYDLVRYDGAGRGAWGSLQLLWVHRLQQPLTTLGGLLIILSVGIDPSIQQLISSSDCSITIKDENATLPRTNLFYDPSTLPIPMNRLSGEFQSALLRGLAQSGGGLYPECSTGNCSFSDLYGTIGYCSVCEDSSKDIVIETFYTTAFNRSTDLNIDCTDNSSVIHTIKSSIPFGRQPTPASQELSQLNVTNSLPMSTSSPCYTLENFEVAKTGTIGGYSYTLDGNAKVTVNILFGKTPMSDSHIDITSGYPIDGCEQENSTDSWRCRGYGAATCTIQPCVQVYNATIEAGRLTEHLVSQSGTLDWASGNMINETLGPEGYRTAELGMIDTHCLTPQDIDKLANQGYNVEKTNRWLPYSAVDSEAGFSLANSLLTQKCLYFLDNTFTEATASPGIASNFEGRLTAAGGSMWGNGFLVDMFDGPQTLQHMYDSGHIDFDRVQQTFSNISESLTAWIRTHGHENYSEPAVGQVLHYATCTQVQWRWISFASSIIILTVGLFIATVCSQPLKQFPAWKTSFLPWLMCGPGSAEILKADELEVVSFDVDGMEKMAKQITVTWKPLPDPHMQL